jgi:hypothetical protein
LTSVSVVVGYRRRNDWQPLHSFAALDVGLDIALDLGALLVVGELL